MDTVGEGVMEWFLAPKLFNYVILTLYLLNSGWWAWHKSWGDALYWIAAFQITAAVTWGYNR